MGGRSQGLPAASPSPCRAGPSRRCAEGGRGGRAPGPPRVSLSLRHRPRSWSRRSGRYRGAAAGSGGRRRGVPGTRPREGTFPFLRSAGARGAGRGWALARARAAFPELGRASGLSGGRAGSAPPWAAAGDSRELPRRAAASWCPRRSPFLTPDGFPEPAPPGSGEGAVWVSAEEPQRRRRSSQAGGPLWTWLGCGSGPSGGGNYPRPGLGNGRNRGGVLPGGLLLLGGAWTPLGTVPGARLGEIPEGVIGKDSLSPLCVSKNCLLPSPLLHSPTWLKVILGLWAGRPRLSSALASGFKVENEVSDNFPRPRGWSAGFSRPLGRRNQEND